MKPLSILIVLTILIMPTALATDEELQQNCLGDYELNTCSTFVSEETGGMTGGIAWLQNNIQEIDDIIAITGFALIVGTFLYMNNTTTQKREVETNV